MRLQLACIESEQLSSKTFFAASFNIPDALKDNVKCVQMFVTYAASNAALYPLHKASGDILSAAIYLFRLKNPFPRFSL